MSNHLGQTVSQQVRQHLSGDGQSLEVECGNLSDGIYHVEVTQGHLRFTNQLVLQRTR